MSEPLAELDESECLTLLANEPVGRVGITVGSLPVILPVNFAVVDGFVVFQTSPGTKLRAATSNHVVAFEVDSYQPDGHSGWSVLVQGIASATTEPEVVDQLLSVLGARSGVTDIAGAVVKIKIERISGRRFGAGVI
jgi:nitroimidazol reductase NimA-like FMN-containing flavoprotein (pyridoxamine 5'-phosphate oxidase superfamily)